MTVSRLVHILRKRVLSLFQKERLDDQLDEELSFHLEQLRQENVDAGMSPEEAHLAAKRALGNMAVFKEECRDQRRVGWLHDFFQDVRYGLRMMRKHAGLTAIAAISLASGIGGSAVVLSVGSSLLLGKLQLPDAGRLVVIRTLSNNQRLGPTGLVSVPEYVAWKERSRSFESIGLSIGRQLDLSGDEAGSIPERVFGQAVTPSLLKTLNVEPLMGRVFREDEVSWPPARVIVLSHDLWQRRFSGAQDIIGKQIRLNGLMQTVIGVMPPGFWYPDQTSEYWVPLVFSPSQLKGSSQLFRATARLKAGTTTMQAQADLEGINGELARDYNDRYKGWRISVEPLREFWFGWVRQPLLMLQGAALVVLLIACANVSTLLLARVSARRPEIAMRLLMGAGRGRIVRQFLTESFLLSLVGGALGLFVAWWGLYSLEGLDPPPGRIPISSLAQGAGILGFAALLSVISSVLFGLLPALAAFSSANDVHRSNVHTRRRNSSDILVSAQIGLALMLLISSGLMINSFIRLVLDERGFDPEGVLTFHYRIPVQDYIRPFDTYHGLPAMDARPPTQAIQRVYEKLRALPGAESVGGSSAPPVNVLLPETATLHLEGQPFPRTPEEREAATVVYFLVTENFFPTLKTPILRGRDFGSGDTASAQWVAVINEAMARRFWPGEDPIGKRFTVDAISGEQIRDVIGVVPDVPLRYIRTGPPQAVAYTLYLQQPERYQGLNTGMFGQMTFFIRTKGDPLSLAPAARRAVAEVDPDRPISNIQTMSEFVGDGMRSMRFYVSTLSMFALMATVLAAVGVYGLMTYSVSQRTREIGIRIAMGATPRDIVTLVGGRALRLIAAGLIFGLLGSAVVTRLLKAQLWGVTPTDPATYVSVTVLLVGVSLVACIHPARRAMRVDPTVAIRTD